MECTKCHEPIETGAAFCGNCGQPVHGGASGLGVASVAAAVPSYAVTSKAQHAADTKAVLSLVFGVIGLVGSLFMALLALALGLAGVIMGTLSRRSTKRSLSTAGMILSAGAIFIGLGAWSYALRHDPRFNPEIAHAAPNNSTAVTATEMSTPCYSVGFIDEFNIANKSDSCDLNAYNGKTLESSTNIYKIYANSTDISTASAFMSTAKPAIASDIKKNLPSFEVDNERVGTFAGSPAYIVEASDKDHGIAVVEAAVLHQGSNKKNAFVFVHAANSAKTDLDILESQWQWK